MKRRTFQGTHLFCKGRQFRVALQRKLRGVAQSELIRFTYGLDCIVPASANRSAESHAFGSYGGRRKTQRQNKKSRRHLLPEYREWHGNVHEVLRKCVR